MTGGRISTVDRLPDDTRDDLFYTAETFCGGTGIPPTNDPSVPAIRPHHAGAALPTQEAITA